MSDVASTALLIVTVACVVTNAVIVAADPAKARFVLANSAEVGLRPEALPYLAALKGAGAAGLAVGLAGITPLVLAAAVGLAGIHTPRPGRCSGIALFCLCAVAAHVRASVFHSIAFPAISWRQAHSIPGNIVPGSGVTGVMDFFDALVRYETRLWNLLDARLLETGAVSLATLTSLRVIDRHPGTCRVQDLRADLAVTVGAASKLVDRLERDGLASRRPHPSDRRSSLVELTSAGEASLRLGREKLERALQENVGADSEVADAAALLARLDARLGTYEMESVR